MFSCNKTMFNCQGIRFIPHRGLVLWCDFAGYRAAEIGDKVRPAIIVSPWKFNRQTAYVVPVSQADSWSTSLDIQFPAGRYPFFTPGIDQWAKTQLLTHVELARLDRMRIGERWCTPAIGAADLRRVLDALTSIFSDAQSLAA